MAANEFLRKLKVQKTDKLPLNLKKMYESYTVILKSLSVENRGMLSINVLCMMCRNLDEVPNWKDSVDWNDLLTLCIDCVRETRSMERSNRVKSLACVYKIHGYVIKQPTDDILPKLVLKLSVMPFEVDTKYLLKEYNKTYWNILIDRITYMEKINNITVNKLLPKLFEDLLKTIEIFDPVYFCMNILVLVFKKLFCTFNQFEVDLNKIYVEILEKLSLREWNFKDFSDTDALDLYMKFNDCLFVIAENSSKIEFKDFPIEKAMKCCVTILGQSPDLFLCYETLYIKTFCSIFTSDKENTLKALKMLLMSLETIDKLGNERAMKATYPFLKRLLIFYIEYKVNNNVTRPWKDYFDISTQEICLKIMLILMKRIKNCKQVAPCEDCQLQSGMHDSIRVSFVMNVLINLSLKENLLVFHNQSIILSIIEEQCNTLTELEAGGCSSFHKYFRKCQTDIHNCAVNLNKAKYYEFAIKVFNIYIKQEISYKNSEYRYLTRGLYNKGISELSCKLYKNALMDAFLSLIFYQNEDSKAITEKYMYLVMDIKSRKINDNTTEDSEENKLDDIQYLTVVDAWNYCIENDLYGIKSRLRNTITSLEKLLEHEFAMYCKAWPSMAPIVGILKSLLQIYHNKHENIQVDQESIIWTLINMILQTASNIKTMHDNDIQNIVTETLHILENMKVTFKGQITKAALLLLNTEYSLKAASDKYEWKHEEDICTPDITLVPITRTLLQEHDALSDAFKALDILTQLLKHLQNKQATKSIEYVRSALPIYQIYVYQFLHLSRLAQGLQMAYICCKIAEYLDDASTYIKNAGVILYHTLKSDAEIISIKDSAFEKLKVLSKEESETEIIFLCDAAMFFINIDSTGEAARLVLLANAKILNLQETNPEINLDMAIGRLMEVETLLCDDGPYILTAINGSQRYYLQISISEKKWSVRRSYTLSLRYHIACASIVAVHYSNRLDLQNRAAAAAIPCLEAAGAIVCAKLYLKATDTFDFNEGKIVENRLNYILGVKGTKEVEPLYPHPPNPCRSDLIEPVREQLMFKKALLSPTCQCAPMPAYKISDYLLHEYGCNCYACLVPVSFLIACQIAGLAASTYFIAEEYEIAENNFKFALEMIQLVEKKFETVACGNIQSFVLTNVQQILFREIKLAKLDILIKLCYFEMKMTRNNNVAENLERIHKIHLEFGRMDKYLEWDICNLMAAITQARKVVINPNYEDLSSPDVENSPVCGSKEVLLTPIGKGHLKTPVGPNKEKAKFVTKIRNIGIIKLNLEDNENDIEPPKKNKSKFKKPEPKIIKPSLELATPNPKTAKTVPKILITQPSTETDTETSPEQCFTPLSETHLSIYYRQSLVKNLNNELANQNIDEEEEQVSSNKFSVPKRKQKSPKPSTSRCSENMKSPKPSTSRCSENMKSPKPSTSRCSENMKSPKPLTSQCSENIKSPKPSTSRCLENMKSPKPSTSRCSENMKSPKPSTSRCSENMKSPKPSTSRCLENMKSPKPSTSRCSENMKSPKPSTSQCSENMKSPKPSTSRCSEIIISSDEDD